MAALEQHPAILSNNIRIITNRPHSGLSPLLSHFDSTHILNRCNHPIWLTSCYEMIHTVLFTPSHVHPLSQTFPLTCSLWLESFVRPSLWPCTQNVDIVHSLVPPVRWPFEQSVAKEPLDLSIFLTLPVSSTGLTKYFFLLSSLVPCVINCSHHPTFLVVHDTEQYTALLIFVAFHVHHLVDWSNSVWTTIHPHAHSPHEH